LKLNQQLKALQEWEFQSKQLKLNLDNKIKEGEEWKTRASRLEEEVVRGRELQHYNDALDNKLTLSTKEMERLNTILRTKFD
jgi:hypothetical protein